MWIDVGCCAFNVGWYRIHHDLDMIWRKNVMDGLREFGASMFLSCHFFQSGMNGSCFFFPGPELQLGLQFIVCNCPGAQICLDSCLFAVTGWARIVWCMIFLWRIWEPYWIYCLENTNSLQEPRDDHPTWYIQTFWILLAKQIPNHAHGQRNKHIIHFYNTIIV